jgi:four helix bundle protein
MEIKSYRDLHAWQRAMDFVTAVYQATAKFPRDEIYGLTSQLRRSAVSVPSNIAEGHGRQSTRDFINFLSIAYGSLNEAQTQIVIAHRLGYLTADETQSLESLSQEVGRLINGLTRSLSQKLELGSGVRDQGSGQGSGIRGRGSEGQGSGIRGRGSGTQ